ncbi:Sec1 domain-containing protein mip3 [Ancistrocladus abbreviatus]
MSVIDVIKSCHDSIQQIAEHIEGAIVYLDAGCTESFQFLGAFPLLLEHGVRAICSLENMCPLDTVVDWNASLDVARKIVVMTSCLLSDTHRYILRCLSTHQDIHLCSIFTSISETAHSAYPDSPLGPDAFHEYESLLVQDYEELASKHKAKFEHFARGSPQENLVFEEEGWSQLDEDVTHLVASPRDKEDLQQKLIVSVHHFPMILCPLSPRVFVLPSGGSVAGAFLSAEHDDSLSPGLPPLSKGRASDGEDFVPGATLTAHFLYYLVAKMDLKLEIFSFGDLSKTVGKILTDMSSLYDVGRRKRSAGLLLIDRTLDLQTPCCHGDSFFDRIFSILPRRERAPSSIHAKNSETLQKKTPTLQRAPLDAQIPLCNVIRVEGFGGANFRLLESIEAVLCGWNSSSSASNIQELFSLSSKIHDQSSLHSKHELLNGSFIAAEKFRGMPYLEAVLDRRMKDGTILVRKWLQETLRKENVVVHMKARPDSVTKLELEPMIKALAQSDSSLLRNKGIFQLATATLIALDEQHLAKWDAFISAEKMLNVCAGDTSQNLAAQIGDLIHKSINVGSLGGKLGSSGGLLSLRDVLLLTIIGYILAGENFPTSGSSSPFSWQEEHLLKEAIVDAIFENPAAAKLKFIYGLIDDLEAYRSKISLKETNEEPKDELSIDDLDDDHWGKWGDEDSENDSNKEQVYDDMQLKLELRDRVDNLFRFFHKLSSLSKRNLPLREGSLALESGIDCDSFESKGLLYKLLMRILGKYDTPGIVHHSSTVGRLFKSGLGRFGLGQAKPTLADQNVILVFVIGGINGREVREAVEALSECGRPDIELIVGGTTLLTPDDMVDLLLGDSSYF